MNRPAGKLVGDDLYLHHTALQIGLKPEMLRVATEAKLRIKTALELNVLKINERVNRVSWLAYENFDESPFPRLIASWTFNFSTDSPPTERRYQSSLNPPILHRKELLVDQQHPKRGDWEEVTRTAEDLGLFDVPNCIGFQLNWDRIIEAKGYRLEGNRFLPLGNVSPSQTGHFLPEEAQVQRHLTALTRAALSAPVQLLLRHSFLESGVTFFDYGCGRGNDIATLQYSGVLANGWDPHFASNQPLLESDVVNLGFVINVIEDAGERVDALHRAFRLAKKVLSVSVMLQPSEPTGIPFNDGVLTTRNTFQKYYTQAELKSYVEEVLQTDALLVGPGIVFVFADKSLQQLFESSRYRSSKIARRIATRPIQVPYHRPRKVPFRSSAFQRQFDQHKELLDTLWFQSLELGRYPDSGEVDTGTQKLIIAALGSYRRALRLLATFYDSNKLEEARQVRISDLAVYLAVQQFSRRRQYRNLEPTIQRNIKAFFGDYLSAQARGFALLKDCANTEILSEACKIASTEGLGWLEPGHSLQLHVSLIERLPAVLRVYVECGLVLWGSLSEVQLIKIHINSGKLTLMEFDDFYSSPTPSMRRRVKVNVRKLDYAVFEYGSESFPKPLLYFKSRYLHEEYPGFAEQLDFDEELARSGCLGDIEFGPSASNFRSALQDRRLEINGMQLVESSQIPNIDEPCGANFSYRSLIECGETQAALGIGNLPKNAKTYNALYALAVHILDPVIDYFGSIRLTYGLCTAELGKHISKRVAHDRDQHASCELKRNGTYICGRMGAACDFIVDDEDMLEVAKWIVKNLPYDRLYFYGSNRPLHVSYGPNASREAYEMHQSESGRLVPRRLLFSS